MTEPMLATSLVFSRLIRCLSDSAGIAFEVFSPELTPLLSPTEDRTVALLRRAVTGSEDEGARAAIRSALRTGARQQIKTSSLVIELRPVRDGARMVGLLAGGCPDASGSRSEQHLEVTGEAIQQVLEAEVLSRRAAGARERQYDRWLRLIGFLPGLATEAELIDAFLQALAIWHDLDTHVYVRDVDDRFVLTASLPASRNEGPAQLSSSLVGQRWLEHISSVAELERFGWFGPPYELTLIPIGPQDKASYALAIRAILDARLESDVLTACRILEVCLDRAVEREERSIEDRFSQRLHEAGGAAMSLPALIQTLIDDLARMVGAERGAFVAGTNAERQNNAASADATGVNRILVPLALPGPTRAIEFSTSSTTPLTARHLKLARAGTRTFTHWLLGLNQASQIMEREQQARADTTGSGSFAT